MTDRKPRPLPECDDTESAVIEDVLRTLDGAGMNALVRSYRRRIAQIAPLDWLVAARLDAQQLREALAPFADPFNWHEGDRGLIFDMGDGESANERALLAAKVAVSEGSKP